jgi:hypothetical protein
MVISLVGMMAVYTLVISSIRTQIISRNFSDG